MGHNRQIGQSGLDELKATLDVHGANMQRWPQERRKELREFIARDAAAALLLREAEAMDRVLGQVMKPDDHTVATLSARIAALAAAEGQPDVNNVVAFKVPRVLRPYTSRLPGRLGAGRDLAAASVLAASLALGIFAGSAGWFDPALAPVAHSLGIENVSGDDLEGSELAFGSVAIDEFEEDFL